MLDIGWTEILLIAAVAIVVIGPKDLPRTMRFVGRWAGKAKRAARDFQRQFNDALREVELDDVKKDIEAIGKIDPMADLGKTDPVGDLNKEADKIGKEIRQGLDKPADAPAKAKTETETAKASSPAAPAEPSPPSTKPPVAPPADPAPAAGDLKS